MIVAFRILTRLPLDDCLYALRHSVPQLTRSSLHRCLQHYEINRLADTRLSRALPRPAALGHFMLEIARLDSDEGVLYYFIATDMKSRLFFGDLYPKADQRAAARFLRELVDIVPYPVRVIATSNIPPFAEKARPRSAAIGEFDRICARYQIVHARMHPDHAWSANKSHRIESPKKGDGDSDLNYRSHAGIREGTLSFILKYNLEKRLKCLKGLTPYEYICEEWRRRPQTFLRDPAHYQKRLNNLPAERSHQR